MENRSKIHPVMYVDADLLKIQKKMPKKFFELDLENLSGKEEDEYMQNVLKDDVRKYFIKLEKLRKTGLIKPVSFSSNGMIESYTVEGIHGDFLFASE